MFIQLGSGHLIFNGGGGAEDYPRSKLFFRHSGEANFFFENYHVKHNLLLVRNQLFGGKNIGSPPPLSSPINIKWPLPYKQTGA